MLGCANIISFDALHQRERVENIKAAAFSLSLPLSVWENAFVLAVNKIDHLLPFAPNFEGLFRLSLSGKKKNTHFHALGNKPHCNVCVRCYVGFILLLSSALSVCADGEVPLRRQNCTGALFYLTKFWVRCVRERESSQTEIYKIASVVWTFVAFSSIWGLQCEGNFCTARKKNMHLQV